MLSDEKQIKQEEEEEDECDRGGVPAKRSKSLCENLTNSKEAYSMKSNAGQSLAFSKTCRSDFRVSQRTKETNLTNTSRNCSTNHHQTVSLPAASHHHSIKRVGERKPAGHCRQEGTVRHLSDTCLTSLSLSLSHHSSTRRVVQNVELRSVGQQDFRLSVLSEDDPT